MRTWLALFILCLPGFARAFGLNDASVLLPLPRTDLEATFLAGTSGFLPESALKKIPRLLTDDIKPQERLAQLRVVAFRFDPCFHEGAVFEGAGPVQCRRQIRLVFQPVSKSGADFLVFDAAVHAFFEFDADSWREVLGEWRALNVDSAQSALQVHPLIREQGLSGSHWSSLRKLLTKFCKPERLVRVTTSTTNAFGTQWNFSGFDLKGGERQLIEIARTGKKEQSFFTDYGNLKEFFGDVIPQPEGQSDWTQFLRHSVGARSTMASTVLAKIGVDAVEIENPIKQNPGTVDCVSCHVAQNVRFWAETNLRGFKQSAAAKQSWFVSEGGWNLQNVTRDPFYTNRVRSFGYLVFDPIVSQRVINETAVAADQLSKY